MYIYISVYVCTHTYTQTYIGSIDIHLYRYSPHDLIAHHHDEAKRLCIISSGSVQAMAVSGEVDTKLNCLTLNPSV